MSQFKISFGAGGVPTHDNPRAYRWEARLRWIMAAVALLAVPAFYLEDQMVDPGMRKLSRVIELAILIAFALELAWMLKLVDQRVRYLRQNWLDPLIIVCSLLTFIGVEAGLVALARFMRFTLIALLLLRTAASIRGLFLPGRVRYLLLVTFGLWLLSGLGFYWLEPTVHSFGDGLWLAFVTGATVGYGDLVPTSLPARLFAVLSVLVGFTLLSLMTAYVASSLIGQEERKLGREMHQEIRQLRQDVAQMLSAEESAFRRELRDEMLALKEEIRELREDLRSRAPRRSEDR